MKKFLIILLFLTPLINAQPTTEIGIKLIRHFEGFRGRAYYCPASVLTIGYGSTTNVKPGQIITEFEATILLMKDLARFEKYVMSKVARPLKWHEFDAMVSFTFNVGYRITPDMQDAMNKGNASLLVYHIRKYNKARIGGILKILPGLDKRRKSESKLYKCAVLIL